MAVMEAIATTYLEADQTSVTFSSLGSYEHLQVRISGRVATGDPFLGALGLRMNGDTGTNYQIQRMWGTQSTSDSQADAGQSAMWLYWYPGAGQGLAAQRLPPFYTSSVIDIGDYRNANKNTTVFMTTGQLSIRTEAGDRYMYYQGGMWDDTAAVTSLTFLPGWGTHITRGSMFSLYGLNSS